MGLREEARAAVAVVTDLAEAEGSAGAATNDQIEAAESNGRHGVPDTHVYDPDKGAYLAPGKPQQELERLRASVEQAQAKAAPPVVVQGGTLHLTPEQYRMLLRPINPNRVKQRQGQSHLEAWDVRRHLTRIFGFGGFEITTVSKEKIFQHIAQPGEIVYGNGGTNKRPAYTVVYDCVVRLKVYGLNGTSAVYEDAATGDGSNMPSYQAAADFAIKTAFSQALKRCAVNLGDQFGLSLYNGGSYDPVINATLVGPTVEGGDVERVAQSDVVRGEEETQAYLDDPGRHPDSDSNGMPSARELRDEATDPGTSLDRLRAIYAMVSRRGGSHPELGQTEITNENNDPEPLDGLVWRKLQEKKNALR